MSRLGNEERRTLRLLNRIDDVRRALRKLGEKISRVIKNYQSLSGIKKLFKRRKNM